LYELETSNDEDDIVKKLLFIDDLIHNFNRKERISQWRIITRFIPKDILFDYLSNGNLYKLPWNNDVHYIISNITKNINIQKIVSNRFFPWDMLVATDKALEEDIDMTKYLHFEWDEDIIYEYEYGNRYEDYDYYDYYERDYW
jgi:hypothetical protein